MRDNLIPILFFLFMIINIYLDKTKRKKRREQRRREQEQQLETQEPEILMDPPPKQEKPQDLAAEFERRLKKTTEAAEAEKRRQRDRIVTDGGRVHRDDEPVMHDNKGRVLRDDGRVVHDNGRIHRDGEPAHDTSGRIHRDNEGLVHDKSKVYYDPHGDYSYDEAKMNAAAAAFNAYYAKEQAPVRKKRMKLKHAALVNGFIMAEVLDKPRALKPYEEDCR